MSLEKVRPLLSYSNVFGVCSLRPRDSDTACGARRPLSNHLGWISFVLVPRPDTCSISGLYTDVSCDAFSFSSPLKCEAWNPNLLACTSYSPSPDLVRSQSSSHSNAWREAVCLSKALDCLKTWTEKLSKRIKISQYETPDLS